MWPEVNIDEKWLEISPHGFLANLVGGGVAGILCGAFTGYWNLWEHPVFGGPVLDWIFGGPVLDWILPPFLGSMLISSFLLLCGDPILWGDSLLIKIFKIPGLIILGYMMSFLTSPITTMVYLWSAKFFRYLHS